jgi:hypothetical protein
MSRNLAGLAILASSLLTSQFSYGQSQTSGYSYSYNGATPAPASGYGWGFGYHSSTAFEGYARGRADVIRAKGEANLNNALAQREWESAYKQYLENRVNRVRTFYERREIYNQQQAKYYAERRDKLEAYLERIRLTDLTPQELNPATGSVAWPTLLADEAFSDYSSWFDQLLAERAKYGEISPKTLGQAKVLIKQWRGELTQVKDQVSEAMLRDSLRFLLRLDRELDRQWS